MRSMMMGAALATVMGCVGLVGGVERAEASTFTIKGHITYLDLPNGGASVGDAVTIYFVSNTQISYSSTSTTSDFYASGYVIDDVTGQMGSGDGQYISAGELFNNGNKSGGLFLIENAYTAFGNNGGMDGSLGVSFSSSTDKIPINPEQSFGPIAITGAGGVGASPYSYDPDTGLPVGGFTVGFDVTSIEGVGTLSAVPLPSSAPLFGAALLVLGAAGYGLRRNTTA